jgi:hypothetical protein
MWAMVGVLVAAMMLLVACGEDGSNDSETSRTDDALAATAPEELLLQSTGGGADGDAGGGAAAATADREPSLGAPQPGNTGVLEETFAVDEGSAPVAFQQIGDGRIIIYTSNMLVEVEDVSLATRQAQTAIAGLGGLVFGQDTTTEPFPRTVLTFRVLPDEFQAALNLLAGLGDLESQQVSTNDVTDRVVDLESRITTSEASVERLREFLSNAVDLEDVAQLEAQLLQRETNLELLRGQLRTVQDQAALATIFLTLVEPTPDAPEARVELVQTAYLGGDEGARCPGDDELEADEGDALTLCVEVENTGNLALSELEVRDGGLDLDEDDFVVLEGSLAGPLEPGDRLVGYFEMTAEPFTNASPRFSAVVIDEDGEPIRVPIGTEVEAVELDVAEDTSVPSFMDGLTGSLGAVFVLAQVGVLALGVAIPFFWAPLIVVGLIWLGRRMTPRRAMPTPATSEGDSGD